MSTGRTKPKWIRVYADGYDLSGFGRTIGPLELTYDEADLTAPMSDTVKGYLRNHAQVNLGTLNAVFDNTASTGIHALLGTAGIERVVTVAYGIRAAPAAGDPAFCGQFTQGAYQAAEDGGALTVTVPFQGWAADASTLKYAGPWGTLLHASGTETAVNAAVGFDNPTGAATAKGGYFVYHIFASNAAGTATVIAQDAATNTDPSFALLAGATSGAIGFAAIPASGVVALANNADVRRYLRWQLTLAGGMTTCTFVSAFVRAY